MSSTLPQASAHLLERLKQLGSDWPSEPALRSLSPHVVDVLIDRFVDIEKRRMPIMKVIALVYVVAGACFAFVCLTNPLYHTVYFRFLALLVLGMSAAGVFTLYRAGYAAAGGHPRYFLYALTQTDCVSVLPILLRGTQHEWGLHSEVFRALQRLLGLVREEHAGLLDDAAQYRLWELAVVPLQYKENYNEPLALETLRALAYIGNATTLGRMQHLAEQTPRRKPHRRVIEAAQELALLMEARLKRQEVPATLLRSSEMPTSRPEMLLRAAHAVNPEPAIQLLRAAMSEEREL